MGTALAILSLNAHCKQTKHYRDKLERSLCPYFQTGTCRLAEKCPFIHGDVCDMCNVPCLHPTDAEQRAQHRRECLAEHEAAMEEAFAAARSVDKTCGICMENIRYHFFLYSCFLFFFFLFPSAFSFSSECIKHFWRMIRYILQSNTLFFFQQFLIILFS